MPTKIEWTRGDDGTPGETWNPVKGCDKCSPGCANCFAVNDTWRMAHNPNSKIAAANAGLVQIQGNGILNWTGDIRCLPERLEIPLRWRKARRVFVNSQSDLFHPEVPDEFIACVFAVMALAPQHTFQVLTKRPERMAAWVQGMMDLAPYLSDTDERTFGGQRWEADVLFPPLPLPNVWLGVSVENQSAADARIPHLLRTPAAVRFLSCEPLLGPVDVLRYLTGCHAGCDGDCSWSICPQIRDGEPEATHRSCPLWDWERDEEDELPPRLDWIIAGGESGTSARPMHPDWARSLRDQCQTAGVQFFFKQWGEWLPQTEWERPEVLDRLVLPGQGARFPDDLKVARVGKKLAGRLLDGHVWDQFPTLAGVS